MRKIDKMFQKQVEEVLTALSESSDAALLALTDDEIAEQWYWNWEESESIEWNVYNFSSKLEMQKHRWRRWETYHYGGECVVERVRDKYVMRRVREFIAVLYAHK